MPSRRTWLILIAVFAVLIVAVIVGTALFVPQDNPAFAAARQFADAVQRGDEAAATDLLTPELAEWVASDCPQGLVTACVADYIPETWGNYLNTVFRRAAPLGNDWHVDLIATYEQAEGGSGVCIYTRMVEQNGAWRVAAWAGFIHCGDPASRNMAENPDAPNRVPESDE